MALPDREEQPRFRFPGFCQDVDSVCPNGPQAHACRERLAITFAQSPSASRSTRKSVASWIEKRTAAHVRRRFKRKMAGFDVPSSLPKWRAAIDEDE
jgi:hypothetical protein